MPTKYWIKLYHEILHDPKMARMPDRLWRRTIELFLIAGETGDDGSLPPIDDIAWALRVDAEQLAMDMQQLERLGILSADSSGWYVTKFTERQGAMPKAEYMRRKRGEAQKQEYYQPVTTDNSYSNTPVTSPVTNGNADIDIDTDKKRGEENHPGSSVPLVEAFTQKTGLSELDFTPKDKDALIDMTKAGVEPCDVVAAVDVLDSKQYTIRGPSSVKTAALSEMRKRKTGPPGGAPGQPQVIHIPSGAGEVVQ